MNINYIVEGKGETLVLIHGLSDSLIYWEVLATNLKKDFEVVRFDLRGHGESPLADGEITVGTYADDLKCLLDSLNVEQANLVGFSLGGCIAMDFAIRFPDYVSSLVLMSSFHRADDYLDGILNQFKDTLNDGFEEFYDYILPMVLCPEVIDANKEELELIKQIASKAANTEAYIKAVDACMNLNLENDLSEIDVPTLILAGKHDEISRLDTQKDINSKIQNSRLIVLDDVKHNLLVGEKNQVVLDILKDFIKNKEK